MLQKKSVLAAVAAMSIGFLPGMVLAQDNAHVGALSCAASNCHGGTAATAGVVDGNEHAVWLAGPHSKAYRKLSTDRARLIASNLGLGDPESAGLCLGCHTDNVPAALQGGKYDVAEGVSCESCHGGASGWLDSHSEGGKSIDTLMAAGLYPTWDPVARAEMCLDCHFGAKDQFAGHRLMGAGHPRVSFELDSYTYDDNVLHHTVDADYLDRKPFVDGARSWAIGEAVMIERRMDLLIDQNTGMNGSFPEFVFFECHTCHQPMSVKRRPSPAQLGAPKVDDSHMKMLLVALSAVDPAAGERLDDGIQALHRAASRSRGALVDAAEQMKDSATRAVETFAASPLTTDQVRGMLMALSGEAASGRLSDYGSAEQATLVIGSTLAALADAGGLSDAEYNALFDRLGPAFSAVDRDDGYSADRFESAMQAFDAALR